ncbi:MAG: hypothetical protein COZ20_03640 [Gallionellales bacterium CG_4_10_14_3_um_filter_54_96]|nr:MAG: hypothetical protein COZ20_03640 [Gallionellales bacterium CG_4_10_14_3_um_filter_54_96]
MTMASLVFGGSLAQAITLPADSVPGVQKNINPKVANPNIAPKKINRIKGSQPITMGCPKLAAQELHIVRAVPQPGHPGEYRFILDGTIVNHGFAGVASFGMNAYQTPPGGTARRIALNLLKQNVRRNQRLSISRDLHMTVQSDPISRETSSVPSFTLSVLNMNNDKGQCSERSPTVATVSTAKVRQAFPVQPHGDVSQQVGTLKKNGAGAGLSTPKPLFGQGKPVTGRDGKSLIPPKIGPMHVLGGDAPATPHVGFAAAPKAGKPVLGRDTPITGRDGNSLVPENKLKLELVEIKANNQSAFYNGVSIGDRATALLNVHNLSNTTERIKVAYMINGHPRVSDSFTTVAPRQTVPVMVNVRINGTNFDGNVHLPDGVGDTVGRAVWLLWSPVFALVTERNNPYRDVNMADNSVGQLEVINIPVIPKNDLAVVGIEGVTLTETWHGGGSLDEGTIHPVSLAAIIRVKNNGSQTSRPMTMSVGVISTREAVTSARGSRGAEYDRVGSCASWPTCAMSQDLSIAAIPAGQTVSFPVHFAPIPHTIEHVRHHAKLAGGPYVCGRGSDVMSSSAKIGVTLRTADEDDAAFTQNNTLTKEGKFGTAPQGRDTVTCGFQ